MNSLFVTKKLSYYLGVIALGMLFGVLIGMANFEIRDLDLWLHLASGRHIVQTMSVPSVDFLSCSIAGQHWVNHEWLFQVGIYYLYEMFGPAGWAQMQMVLVSVTMLFLVLVGFQKDRLLQMLIPLIAVFAVYQQRFTVRPDLFSLLFFSVYIYIMSTHIDKKWSLFVLFIVQVLWTNIHGFFFFGPFLLLIGIGSEWIKEKITLPYEWNDVGRLTEEENQWMKYCFLASIVACLVNPQFIEGAMYPINVLMSISGDSQIFFKYIQELQKPIPSLMSFADRDYQYFKLLIILSAISFVFNRKRIDISALILWGLFLAFSLKAMRNVSFFAFAAYYALMSNLFYFDWKQVVPLRFVDARFKYLTLAFVNILIIVWLFGYANTMFSRGYFDFDNFQKKSEFGGVTLRGYPDKAVDFLVENKIHGNFLNDFNSGAYLLGRTHPQIKVFIDGRTEAYGSAFFKQYKDLWENGNREIFDRVVKEYKITGALLNSSRAQIPAPLLKLFYDDPEWALVYFNYDAMIFLKRVKMNQRVIDQYEMDLENWEPPAYDMLRLGAKIFDPINYYYRAFTLESLELSDQALKELRIAIAINPNYGLAYDLQGKIYGNKKEFEKSFQNFRLAVAYEENNQSAHFNLARAYLELKDYPGSIREYYKILNMWPGQAKTYFLLANAYIEAGSFDEAIKAIQAAHVIEKNNTRDPIHLGEVLEKKAAFASAEQIYNLIIADNPANLTIIKKKLRFLLTQGKKDSAEVEDLIDRLEELNVADEEITDILKNPKDMLEL